MPRTLKEVEPFMHRERLAAFCTVDARNQPHAVPVWFTYDAGKVYIQTDRHSAKTGNLRLNDRVAVVVYHEEEAVIIRGTARIVEDTEFVRRTHEHVAKYQVQLDEQGRDSLGIPLFDDQVRCVVEVTPQRLIFW